MSKFHPIKYFVQGLRIATLKANNKPKNESAYSV